MSNSNVTPVAIGVAALAVGIGAYFWLGGKGKNTVNSAKAVLTTDLAGLKKIYSGKVRDLYEVQLENGKLATLHVATDRLSSFDVVMLNGIPGKGKILTQLSLWWFDQIKRELGVKTHIITSNVHEMPHAVRAHADILEGRCMLVQNLNMLPVEAIVRGYITGSGFKEYTEQGTVCDIQLPSGLKDCEKLENVIFTPSTKAELGTHDINISIQKCEQIIGRNLTRQIEKESKAIYMYGRAKAEQAGILLADTKMEWGLDENKNLILADEVLTPDCSRFWEGCKYEVGRQQDSLDKQYVRNYLLSINFDKATPVTIPEQIISDTLGKYVTAFRTLTGKDPVL